MRLARSWLVALTASGLAAATSSSSTPLPPSEDAWYYTAPPRFRTASPGAVLRVRPAPGNLSYTITNLGSAHNILYRTTDSSAEADWAVTTLLVPEGAAAGKHADAAKSAMVTYLYAYDSADVDASPSYWLHTSDATAAGESVNYAEVVRLLGEGWYVNLPDFEGKNASFTAGVMAGHATLDSVRAVLSANLGPSSTTTAHALWGYSGGSIAGDFAAELAPTYAPELSFSGLAMGGLTPNVLTVAETCSNGTFAGIVPQGIVGLANQFPAFAAFLATKLNPTGAYNASTFLSARDLSLADSIAPFLDQDIWNYFTDGAAFATTPQYSKVIASDGIMGRHGVPAMPVFAYKAVADEVSPVAGSDALIAEYCRKGASVTYNRNTLGTHSTVQEIFTERVVAFLAEVLTGTYKAPASCVVANTTYNVSSTAAARRSLHSRRLY